MELFGKIVKELIPITFFAKNSFIDRGAATNPVRI